MTQSKNARKLAMDSISDRLLKSVGEWVDANGGKALVAGSIGIMDIPGDIFSGETPLNFYVCIKVTGRRPVKPEVA